MDSPPVPPTELPVEAAAPPAIVAPRRRFSWRDFFIGVAAGVMTTLVGLVLLGVGAAMLLKSAMADDSASAVTLPAPEFPKPAQRPVYGQADAAWKFETLAGAPASLADYRGKVVFLNFWATWCGPCVMELPYIQKLQASLKDEPVAFVLVSDEDAPTIQKFTAKKPIPLPLFRTGDTRPPLFVTDGIPTTFIIDPTGTVVFRYVGAAQWNHETVVTYLRGLLAGKVAPGPAR